MIVESPSKGKTIAKYLGKDFRLMSSQGHVRDIEGMGKNSMGIDFAAHSMVRDYTSRRYPQMD